MARAYPAEARERVIALWQDGAGSASVKTISEELGISTVTVTKMLEEAGIELPKRSRNNAAYFAQRDVIDNFVRLYKSGMSLKEIRDKSPVSDKKLRQILRAEGVYELFRPTPGEERVISAEEFVRVVQTSSSFQEVEDKTGLTRQAVHSRYHLFKKNGVPLKKFKRKPLIDWIALAKLAKSLVEEGEGQ